jgi:hypothetical protein
MAMIRHLTLALTAALLLSSCATVLKYDNGTEALRTNTDFESLDLDSKTPHQALALHIRGHKPSTTIRASGSVTGTVASGLAAIIMAWLSKGVVK